VGVTRGVGLGVPVGAYAHEDRLQVRELYDKLKAAGFDPWLDHEHSKAVL
jgi:hypothetical protein